MQNKNINWNEYHLNFPRRYFERSLFDERVELFLQTFSIKTALDIGGGKGLGILMAYNINTWLLDPYINASSWMEGKIDWDSDQTFDLVIARGSINYLTEKEIKKISKFGKIFLANSFDKPPNTNWTKRPFSALDGRVGIEYFKYAENLNIIRHKLKFLDSDEIIIHDFYYYSGKQYQEMLGNIKIEKYGKNSILIIRIEEDEFKSKIQ